MFIVLDAVGVGYDVSPLRVDAKETCISFEIREDVAAVAFVAEARSVGCKNDRGGAVDEMLSEVRPESVLLGFQKATQPTEVAGCLQCQRNKVLVIGLQHPRFAEGYEEFEYGWHCLCCMLQLSLKALGDLACLQVGVRTEEALHDLKNLEAFVRREADALFDEIETETVE